MKTGLAALALMASITAGAVPAAAGGGFQGFSTPATVSGQWVLSPRACPDLREDRRDRMIDEGRFDRREDRRDRRILDCPPRAWTFVPDFGQSPGPIRLGRGHWRGHDHGVTHPQIVPPQHIPVRPHRRPRADTAPVFQDTGFGVGVGIWSTPNSGCFYIAQNGSPVKVPCR